MAFSDQMFQFDQVFPQDTAQSTFYERACKNVVDDVLKGFNGTIFAYGQTGAGKSWSMMGSLGNPDLYGLIPRAAAAVFQLISQSDVNIEFKVSCTYLEIYNEQIQDLFDTSKRNLRIHESLDRGVFVADLTTEYVGSEQEIYDLLEMGTNNRVVSFTKMNATSSRSHSVFTLYIQQTNLETGSIKSGKLNLVDLAGSEKVGKTGATGQTLEEAKKINQSLSSLGNCINALVEGKGHVPFRNSRLTRILQQSLGGNSKTTMICAVTPHPFNLEETISTLKFGTRAKSIKCAVKVNAQKSAKELQRIVDELQRQIKILNNHNTKLKCQISSLGATPDVALDDAQTEKPTTETKDDDDDDDDDNGNDDDNPLTMAEMKLEIQNSRLKYKNELQKLQDELEDLQTEDNKIKETAEILRKQLEESEEGMELLLEENEKFEIIKQDLQKKFQYEKQALEIELENAIEQIEELEKTKSELESDLQKARNETGSVQRTSDFSNNDIQHITDPVERGKAIFELGRLRDSEKTYQFRVDRLNEKIETMQTEMEKYRSANVDLETKIERIVAHEARKAPKHEKELQRMTEIVAKLEVSKEDSETQLMELEAELTKLLNEADKQDTQQEEHKKAMDKMQALLDVKEVDFMSLKLEQKNSQLHNKENADEELENFYVNEFNNSFQELRNNHVNMEKRYKAEIKRLEEELEDERANEELLHKDYESQHEKDQDMLKQKDMELEEMTKTIEQMHQLEDSVIQEMNTLRLIHESERNRLKSLLEEEKYTCMELTERVFRLEKQLEQAFIRQEQLKDENVQATKNADSDNVKGGSHTGAGKFTGGLANMANELMDLRSKFHVAETERAKLEGEANKSRRVIASERNKLHAAQNMNEHQKKRVDDLENELESMRVKSTYRTDERESFKKKKEEMGNKIAELEGALEAMQRSASIRRNKVFVPLNSGALQKQQGAGGAGSNVSTHRRRGSPDENHQSSPFGRHILRKTGRTLQ